MTTINTSRIAPKVIAKQITSLPTTTQNIFVITNGPIQILDLVGFVEESIVGTSYTNLYRISASSNSNFSNAFTISGVNAGTMIDFITPFDTPTSGRPFLTPYTSTGIFVSSGVVQVVPSGTPTSGQYSILMTYVPLSPNCIVTVA